MCIRDRYQITITNSQSQATPAPFQQDIAICNGNPNIGSSFAYVNNATLFNEINSNGSNIYFTTTYNSNPNIYSWYEGQLNYNGVTCDVWWVNIPQGIPANSNVTIYMYVGNSSSNYYSLYYLYVGAPIQVLGTSQYDNGQYVFNYYQNFGGLSSLPSGWSELSGTSITYTSTYTEIAPGSSSYSWYGIGLNPIPSALSTPPTIWEFYGNIYDNTTASGIYVGTGTSNGSSIDYGLFEGYNQVGLLYFSNNGYTIAASTGYYDINNNKIYSMALASSTSISILINYNTIYSNTSVIAESPTWFELNPSYGSSPSSSPIYAYWLRARAYPPNGVMPSFSIQQILLTPTISVNTSTNFQFNVSILDPFSEYINYTVYLNGSVLITNNVSVTALQTLTIPYTYQYLFNQSGIYNLTVVAYGQTSGITAIATDIFTINIPPPTAYINLVYPSNLLFNITISDGFSENVNYTVYLNGIQLANGNVQITLPSIAIQAVNVTLPFNYTYLLNQSGYYNLSVYIYGNQSNLSYFTNDTFYIQLDQLNISVNPTPYTYNNTNYTNLYNTNLNINYYCMRPNNTLIIYDNITNQALQFNLSCNYIETPENLFVNLTPYIQNNTLNYINGSLTYGTKSFRNISFIPLWDTVVVNLTIYLPQILVYTAPLGMNYTVIENDILPNVTCNTSFYDNNNLIANNQSILTNGSITYSWIISQSPIHNFNWNITCIDPVNVTTSFTYSTGPYYYNEFNLYMEDSGNIPSNVTYALTLECGNSDVQYSNANDENYNLYSWTNSTCNKILISQQIQGITFYQGFSTNLLSNYDFQWPICLINTSLAYFENPLIGSQPYQDTLIAVENPQTGCYLLGSYLYLSASNTYYAPVPMREGALYVIRVNNTYLATVEGQQSQAISIDNLIAQVYSQNNNTLTEIVTYPTINVTNISANVYQVTVTAPAEVSSVNISVFYNNTPYENYTLNSVNSYNFTVLLNNLPANYTFNSTNYMLITLEYENGVIQQLYYPSTVLSNRVTLPSFMVYLIAILILYAWTRAFSYYQRLIIAGFGLALFIVLMSIAVLQTTAPIVLTAGIFFFFILDVAYSEFISKFMGEHPLLQPLSFLMRFFIIITFVTNLVGLFFGPYGIYNLNLPNLNNYINQVNNTITSLNGTIKQMISNPFNFIFDFIGLAIDVIYAITLAIQGVAVFISLILTPVTVLLGPTAAAVAQAITSIVYYGAIVAILVYLALLVFAAAGIKPF